MILDVCMNSMHNFMHLSLSQSNQRYALMTQIKYITLTRHMDGVG